MYIFSIKCYTILRSSQNQFFMRWVSNVSGIHLALEDESKVSAFQYFRIKFCKYWKNWTVFFFNFRINQATSSVKTKAPVCSKAFSYFSCIFSKNHFFGTHNYLDNYFSFYYEFLPEKLSTIFKIMSKLQLLTMFSGNFCDTWAFHNLFGKSLGQLFPHPLRESSTISVKYSKFLVDTFEKYRKNFGQANLFVTK